MRRMGFVCGATVAAAIIVAVPAQSSQLASPSTDWAYALAIQQDGKIVAAGLSRRSNSAFDSDRFALVRYTSKGRLDAHFGRGGKVLTAFQHPSFSDAVAVQSDGRIVAAGGGVGGFELARYSRRGDRDRSFGGSGRVVTDFGLGKKAYLRARALAVQGDGKIVAVGFSHFALARYLSNGKLDPTFGHGGTVLTRFYGDGAAAAAIQADGKIVVLGASRIVRYTARGKLDLSFGSSGVVRPRISLNALAIQADGNIVAAGGVQGPTHSADFALVRYTPDGELDESFGDGGVALANFGADPTENTEGSGEVASSVAIQADGKIVAAGSTDVRGVFCGGKHALRAAASAAAPDRRENMSICDDFALARFNADGSLDTTFGQMGTVVTAFTCCRSGARESASKAAAVAIQSDGKIVAAGLGAGYDFGLARYTVRGRLDPTFGDGGEVTTDFGSG
jgi:uncharacterized delta-60 repeat protein